MIQLDVKGMSSTSTIGRNVTLGRGVKIWQLTYIGDDTSIGDETSIGSLCHVDSGVTIGRNCRVQGMVYLPPGTVIGDDVFIGPGVVFTNDPYPPSKRLKGVTVEDGAIVCAGATLLSGVTVGKHAVVGMGSVVTRDVPPGEVHHGSPAARRYGYGEYLERRRAWEVTEESG
jgi:UDP-2-acetamido-3-amino-2,3-dideoxy-glucuronate N-acetyltransferase